MKTIFKSIAVSVFMLTCLSCNANNKSNKAEVAFSETLEHETNNQFIKVALLLDTSNSIGGRKKKKKKKKKKLF